ncbi:hypothetical protein BVRB_6g134260 [Beta vulgaris subsp. vulgaris]|nr:hypothetical protein BVRB_6g134260 [Beta vulgaris subsp. vulgaris]
MARKYNSSNAHVLQHQCLRLNVKLGLKRNHVSNIFPYGCLYDAQWMLAAHVFMQINGR